MKDKFVKPEHHGKKKAKRVRDAMDKGFLDSYIMHPETGKPIKVPLEIVQRMRKGESFTLSQIENFSKVN